jgi:hypothetical protein
VGNDLALLVTPERFPDEFGERPVFQSGHLFHFLELTFVTVRQNIRKKQVSSDLLRRPPLPLGFCHLLAGRCAELPAFPGCGRLSRRGCCGVLGRPSAPLWLCPKQRAYLSYLFFQSISLRLQTCKGGIEYFV